MLNSKSQSRWRVPYPNKTPAIFRWILPRLIWHGRDLPVDEQSSAQKKSKPRIYLTFDDGPTPQVTQFVIDQLKEFSAKASFFLIGKNVISHPEIVEELKNQGHLIGNHTLNHLNGWQSSHADYLQEVAETDKLLGSTWFRPPYGKITLAQIRSLRQRYKIVMWDVIAGDFEESLKPEQCLQNVLGNAGDGSIVVLHDSLKAFPRLKFALPKILDHYSELGYEFHHLEQQSS